MMTVSKLIQKLQELSAVEGHETPVYIAIASFDKWREGPAQGVKVVNDEGELFIRIIATD